MKMGKPDTVSVRSLSELILSTRKRREIKQEVLASATGCTRSYISKLESGRVVPSESFAEKLEKALSLRSGTLLRIVRAIRANQSQLKRLALEHARDGEFHNDPYCIYCKRDTAARVQPDGR